MNTASNSSVASDSLWPLHRRAWPDRYRLLELLLAVGGIASLAIAAWDLIGGGFYVELGGIRVSSWEAYKPFRNGVICSVVACWLHDRRASEERTMWRAAARWSSRIALVAACVSTAIALRFGIHAAGGSDAYGYVSEAYLLASGRLLAPDPLADLADLLGPAVAPLGYRLAVIPGWLAPVCPPGLPLLMAAAVAIARSPAAVYVVAPLLAGAAVWLTHVVARRAADPHTALVAPVLLAFAPIFVFQSLEPMSDVPATAWWAAAWACSLMPPAWAALASGLATGAALMTRPNLAPLALVLAAFVFRSSRPAFLRLTLFAAGVAPAVLALALLHRHLYGGVGESGYGHVVSLFAPNRFFSNAHQYIVWLADLHSPVIGLALAAPFVARVKSASWMLLFSAVVLGCYVFYYVFDTWPFVRFLLPALPLLLVLTGGVVMRGIESLPTSARGAALLVCALLPVWYVLKARDLGVFEIHRAEQRYAVVGEAVGRAVGPRAIVLAQIQSGSVRLYGPRLTARWDFIEPQALDATIDSLKARGYSPYLLLEDWEQAQYRRRFGGASRYGAVDWPPMLEYAGHSIVRVYSFDDRERHLAGERIATERLTLAP